MIKRYVPLEYFGGMGLSKDGDYYLYEDHMRDIAEKNAIIAGHEEATESLLAEIYRQDAEIESLSKIINRFYDDCEHLKTKLESKVWEIQTLGREIKRMKEDKPNSCQIWMNCPDKYNGCSGKIDSDRCPKGGRVKCSCVPEPDYDTSDTLRGGMWE